MEGGTIIIILVIAFGVFVFFMAGIQRKSNSRVCPSCNKLVSQVDPECQVCGYDFRIVGEQPIGRHKA